MKRGLTFAADGVIMPPSRTEHRRRNRRRRKADMKRSVFATMMMCEMCMGMMSMCMFLRAQNDRLLSKNCLTA